MASYKFDVLAPVEKFLVKPQQLLPHLRTFSMSSDSSWCDVFALPRTMAHNHL